MRLSKPPTKCNTAETKINNKAPLYIKMTKIAASTFRCSLTRGRMQTHPNNLRLIYIESTRLAGIVVV